MSEQQKQFENQPLAIEQQTEVIANAIDAIDPKNQLGQYLASPSYETVEDEQGRARAQETDRSHYDVASERMADAVEMFGAGKTAEVNVIHGHINAFVDAHKHSRIPNLRGAFESMNTFGIIGSTGFHEMFNPAGKIVGRLEGRNRTPEVSEDDAFALAEGAAHIREGHGSVMFVNFEDKLNSRMYGMKDPVTGEALPNVFMVIKSSAYYDKDGSTSNFSNVASANLVLVPEQSIQDRVTAHEQVKAEKEAMLQPKPFEQNPATDWTKLKDGQFNVQRTNGEVEQGWSIARAMDDPKAGEVVVIQKAGPNGGVLEKTIPAARLVSWQNEQK